MFRDYADINDEWYPKYRKTVSRSSRHNKKNYSLIGHTGKGCVRCIDVAHSKHISGIGINFCYHKIGPELNSTNHVCK